MAVQAFRPPTTTLPTRTLSTPTRTASATTTALPLPAAFCQNKAAVPPLLQFTILSQLLVSLNFIFSLLCSCNDSTKILIALDWFYITYCCVYKYVLSLDYWLWFKFSKKLCIYICVKIVNFSCCKTSNNLTAGLNQRYSISFYVTEYQVIKTSTKHQRPIFAQTKEAFFSNTKEFLFR